MPELNLSMSQLGGPDSMSQLGGLGMATMTPEIKTAEAKEQALKVRVYEQFLFRRVRETSNNLNKSRRTMNMSV